MLIASNSSFIVQYFHIPSRTQAVCYFLSRLMSNFVTRHLDVRMNPCVATEPLLVTMIKYLLALTKWLPPVVNATYLLSAFAGTITHAFIFWA